MNIFGQGFQTTENWDGQSGRNVMDALKGLTGGATVSDATATGSVTASLQQGQVFRGEILNITANDVTILLDNQQVLNAKLGESLELNIGQRMYFEVKENQGEQIFIRPMQNMNPDGQSMAAEKALATNGFAFTERNFTIVNHLMEAGMPLDKESMRKIMQQAMRLPEADIKQLVDMNRLGIPVNEVNVRQFAQYTAHQHQLTQNMQQVLDGLDQAIMAGNETVDLEQMQNLNRQLMDIFGWKMPDTAGMAEQPGILGEENVNPSLTGEMVTEVAAEATTETTQVAAEVTTETAQVAESAQSSENPEAQKTEQTSVTTGQSIINSDLPAPDRTFLSELRTQLMEMGIPEETAQNLTNGEHSYGSILSKVSSLLEQQGLVAEQASRNFFQSDNYRKLVKKGIQEEWLMKPDAMKEPKEIDRLYEKIFRQSAQLEESFVSSEQSGKQFSEQSQNMRENLQFMQQLNQQFIFAQLPMKMNGQDANSELFVYANKKKLQQADGVRVLLHLDMPHLGSTDILVRLKEKMLHATFTMEDETSVSVIAENMEELTHKLEDKGFHFTNDVKQVEVKPQEKGEIPTDEVIEEMFNQDLVTGVKRYTFDMRT